MIRSLLFCLALLQVFPIHSQPLMRDVFAAMPDTLLPMVTRNNRLDCIDFIENDMEARVRNKVDEYVTLEALTPNYARFRTSASAFLELKLINDSLLCMVKTVEAGADSLRLQDSNIFFYTPEWKPLPTEHYFHMPVVEDFVATASLTADEARVIEALRYFCPVRIALSPDAPTLTLIPQTADLDREQRPVAKRLLRELKIGVSI